MKIVNVIFLITTVVLFSLPLQAETDFRVERVTDGLGVTWGMSFISKDEFIFTQRDGDIGHYNIKTGQKTWLSGVPEVFASGQGGMLDVAVSPDYKAGGWIYFTYSKPVSGGAATTLARANLDGDALTNWEDLLITKSVSRRGHHFGSRIAFDESGHLFFGIGDRGKRPNSQDLSNHSGSILRLNLDGTVPDSNPFIGEQNVLPETWSYGHRNPQGLVYDAGNGRLWEIEHGPRGGDEINLVEPGKNYGWPVISYGKEYRSNRAVGESTHKDGMEQPVKSYVPSIAPGSLLFYSGKAFPQWQRNLFAGALKLRHINRVVLNDEGEAIEEERLLSGLKQRIRSLAQSPEGWIYFATDGGEVLRIVPKD